ncbi:hypothetical protein ACWIUH_06600 [Ursidibacter arcticus]
MIKYGVYTIQKRILCDILCVSKTIANKTVTFDFAETLDGATLRSTSEFAQDIVNNL